jgi:glycosyltransferase involved in cell wall biosynthesis
VDLFHSQNTGCEEAPVAARWAGVPHVVGTFHVGSTCDIQRQRNGPRYRVLEMVSNRCLHTAIGVSQAAAQDWIQRSWIPKSRVHVIHNGIDPDKFRRRLQRAEARARLGLGDVEPVIGSVGRLDEAKGYEYLLAAAAALGSEFPGLQVVLAGDGPVFPQLRDQAGKLGIAERVHFLGFQQDVQPVLDSLDVFVLPSLSETLGYALLEAMATELPAVGSTAGGIPEVIAPGETGFLAPARDGPALAATIRPLLDSPELRRQMGAAGRARVIERFHERDMVRKTLELYRMRLAQQVRRNETHQELQPMPV